MAAKTYVALIEDDHEIDVRDPDVIRVAPLDVYRETILDTEGITDDNVGEFSKLQGPSVDVLIQIAETAVAVLDSQGGGYSMAELALLVNAAGFGDFTAEYADEIELLAGEGQTGG